jgi:phosphohistidine swiveling domain-containing protein
MKEKFFKKFEGLNSVFCIQLLAMAKCNDFFGKQLLIDEVIFSKEYYLVAHIFQSDVDRIRAFIFEKMENDPKYLEKIYTDALSDFKKFNDTEATFLEEIVNSNDEKSLRNWIRSFVEIASHTTRLGFVAELFVGYEDFWPAYLQVTKDDFTILTAPEELSFTKEFDYEIAKLRLGTSTMTARQLASKYHWVLSNYNVVDLVDEKYVSSHAERLSIEAAQKTIDDAEAYLKHVIAQKESVYARTAIAESSKSLLSAIASFIVLQDKRKEVILKTNSLFLKAAHKLLDIYGVSSEDRKMIISAGYPLWFSDHSKEELIPMCREAFKCFYFPYRGGIKIGDAALVEYKKEFEDVLEAGIKECKGRVAYPGCVTGKVCVIFKGEDFDSFEDGSVLVTSMTRPEFVPLMKKAIAIVTDEGGITCHAAIVSRELKKPCIIGTKVATQVLKDGDMVEVDANSGIVRILK